MKYDFDKVYERKNTNSLKYDFAVERGKPEDILPLWVADMDFRAPDEVITALKEKADHGIFGYSEPKPDYFETLTGWFRRRHGWETQPDKFVLTCGVVYSISTLIRAVTDEGDAVIVCQPVYYPFAECVEENGRRLIVSELENDGGYYTVNYADFEKKITENGVKAFILCNPHNPVGRVWTREELRILGGICLKHGVFVIADEIHSDFVYGGLKHVVFSEADERFKDICAICTAPTKTFNLAGLHIANTYIYCDEVRERFKKELSKHGYSQPNIMGLVGCKAAYEYGEDWLEQLKKYLEDNIAFTAEYIAANMPKVKFFKPQGTYLLWLDMKGTGLDDNRLEKLVTEKAGLWLDGGCIFGAGGSGFQRINAACPRSVLKIALERLKSALDTLC